MTLQYARNVIFMLYMARYPPSFDSVPRVSESQLRCAALSLSAEP